jgi:hypothetical protein
MYIYVFSVPLYMVYENKDDWLIDKTPKNVKEIYVIALRQYLVIYLAWYKVNYYIYRINALEAY